MEISGVEPQSILPSPSADIQNRKPLNSVRPSEEARNETKERPQDGPSPVRDQVTLSKEAQSLSVSDTQNSKNSTFQQSPSPFDK